MRVHPNNTINALIIIGSIIATAFVLWLMTFKADERFYTDIVVTDKCQVLVSTLMFDYAYKSDEVVMFDYRGEQRYYAPRVKMMVLRNNKTTNFDSAKAGISLEALTKRFQGCPGGHIATISQ